MVRIAQGMQGLTAGKLRLVTVPTGPYAPDSNRVALCEPDAGRPGERPGRTSCCQSCGISERYCSILFNRPE